MSEQFRPKPKQEVLNAEKEAKISLEQMDDGRYKLNDVAIGGHVKSGDDFRDFIVNTEEVGVRMDATLVLPSDTRFEDGENGEVLFTLPTTGQRGRIYRDKGKLRAAPIN